ncbi:HipA N-terminal domain-containing protein [Marinobacter salicampi]|uniref:HipA N-terminal domain-containing protein n=1 Tax=Marinobacter salicampi TaxID=435907 RepID=UPI00140C422C|nr:HipA N-terminal domain-containing protein [Marinobacter salicampi]
MKELLSVAARGRIMAPRPYCAVVYLHGRRAGSLVRGHDESVVFSYDHEYLNLGGPALSLSLPLREETYASRGLPAYFSGLCSEGWLRRIQSFEQKIDPADEFTLLVLNGSDLAGAVTIYPEEGDLAKSVSRLG